MFGLIVSTSFVLQSKSDLDTFTNKVSGTLINQGSGEPVPDKWLTILSYNGIDLNGNPKIKPLMVRDSFNKVKTSESGMFVFSNIPDGTYVIKSGIDQKNFTGDYIRIKKDTGSELVIIKLSAGVVVDIGKVFVNDGTSEIKGVLIDNSLSTPIAGVTLTLFGYAPAENGQEAGIIAISVNGQFPPRTTSDKDGKFSFSGLPARTYVISYTVGSIATDNFLTICRGKFTTNAIKVEIGQILDLGKIQVNLK
jgi:hypothetical protein